MATSTATKTINYFYKRHSEENRDRHRRNKEERRDARDSRDVPERRSHDRRGYSTFGDSWNRPLSSGSDNYDVYAVYATTCLIRGIDPKSLVAHRHQRAGGLNTPIRVGRFYPEWGDWPRRRSTTPRRTWLRCPNFLQ